MVSPGVLAGVLRAAKSGSGERRADILSGRSRQGISAPALREDGPLNRFAEHQQGDEPDYQKDEEENLGDSHGRASDASKTQQSGDDCDD